MSTSFDDFSSSLSLSSSINSFSNVIEPCEKMIEKTVSDSEHPKPFNLARNIVFSRPSYNSSRQSPVNIFLFRQSLARKCFHPNFEKAMLILISTLSSFVGYPTFSELGTLD